MIDRLESRWLNLMQGRGFEPTLIMLLFAVPTIAHVDVESDFDLGGVGFVFDSDGPAASAVLSVIAGSLITVAGLTFPITMVVLQLASSQFSPRILRTVLGDRITQITIGTYIGIFVYSILLLRAVGSFDQTDFVARSSVTLASLLGIVAVVLLIALLRHVSPMVQVSRVTAKLTQTTLAKIDQVDPHKVQDGVQGPSTGYAPVSDRWAQEEPSGQVRVRRSGYVQRVSVDDLLSRLGAHVVRAQITVCHGDFVSIETPIALSRPVVAVDRSREDVLTAITVSVGRDLDQDADFGLRQLADVTLEALLPGINDPMAAVTCISYLRSILARLTESADVPAELEGGAVACPAGRAAQVPETSRFVLPADQPIRRRGTPGWPGKCEGTISLHSVRSRHRFDPAAIDPPRLRGDDCGKDAVRGGIRCRPETHPVVDRAIHDDPLIPGGSRHRKEQQ